MSKTNYKASTKDELLLNFDQIEKNIIKNDFCLVDARGEKRFKGLVDEPRKNLKKETLKGPKTSHIQKLLI